MEQKLNAKSKERQPLVSVAIPGYNAAKTLPETLDSILAQTYSNIEVIVVDDGSTDETQEVLRRYAQKVRTIRQKNGGLASARNAGCRAAQGKYIALMDADDLCMPERIAIQVAYMEQNPEVVMCSSDFTAFNSHGLVGASYISKYYSQIAETERGVAGIYPHQEKHCFFGREITIYSGYVYEQMVLGSFIHPPTVLFRRDILDKCGMVDERIVNCCDSEWFLRMSRIGGIGFIDYPLLKYRFSDNQMSGSRNRLQMTLDMVSILEKTITDDPALLQRNRKLITQRLGVYYLGVADALVDDRPLAAIIMLIRSLKCGVLHRGSLNVLIKAVIPRWVLYWKRKRCARTAVSHHNM